MYTGVIYKCTFDTAGVPGLYPAGWYPSPGVSPVCSQRATALVCVCTSCVSIDNNNSAPLLPRLLVESSNINFVLGITKGRTYADKKGYTPGCGALIGVLQ